MGNFRKFRLEKLVHDGIVQGNTEQGIETDYEVLDETQWIKQLEEKLAEEQSELEAAQTDGEKAKEQQDINDVLYALGRLVEVDYKPNKTFTKRHYVHTLTVPADNYWAEYYGADPKRFPEIPADE